MRKRVVEYLLVERGVPEQDEQEQRPGGQQRHPGIAPLPRWGSGRQPSAGLIESVDLLSCVCIVVPYGCGLRNRLDHENVLLVE